MHQSQNSVQLFHCLANFIIEAAHLNIVVKWRKYMDGVTPVGELLFKLIMNKDIIDTRNTATHLRENLTNLDTHMSTVNSNIKNFNQYTKVKLDGLKAGGEHTDDISINLFKSYQVSSDG